MAMWPVVKSTLVILFLVSGIKGDCSGTLAQGCIKDGTFTVEPASAVLVGTTVTFKFETIQKITDKTKLLFKTLESYCVIAEDKWNTAVDYIVPPSTVEPGKCVTNLTEVSPNLFKYAVTFLKIAHRESGEVEAQDIMFNTNNVAGGKVDWTLEVAAVPQSIRMECDTSSSSACGIGNWDKQEVMLTANMTYQIRCAAYFTRPIPSFSWAIDEDLYFPSNTMNGSLVTPMPGNTSYPGNGWIAWQGISYKALAEHDEKQLICILDHLGYNVTQGLEGRTTFTKLNIQGPPAPAPDVMQPRGSLVAGESATIFVDFHANPGPTSITWYLADMGGPLADNTTSGRYTSHGWKQEAASVVPTTRADFRSSRSYYAVLDIASLSASDNGLEHVLTVQNSQGATNYTFRLEVLDAGLSDGAIAGIVVGVLVAVALVAGGAFLLVRRRKVQKSKKIKEEKRRRREEAGRGES